MVIFLKVSYNMEPNTWYTIKTLSDNLINLKILNGATIRINPYKYKDYISHWMLDFKKCAKSFNYVGKVRYVDEFGALITFDNDRVFDTSANEYWEIFIDEVLYNKIFIELFARRD